MKKMAVTWVDKNESFFKRTHNIPSTSSDGWDASTVLAISTAIIAATPLFTFLAAARIQRLGSEPAALHLSHEKVR